MNDQLKQKVIQIGDEMSKKTEKVSMTLEEWFFEFSEKLSNQIIDECIQIVTEEEKKVFDKFGDAGTFVPYIANELTRKFKNA
jgi:hypothetical protein